MAPPTGCGIRPVRNRNLTKIIGLFRVGIRLIQGRNKNGLFRAGIRARIRARIRLICIGGILDGRPAIDLKW